MSYKLLLVDMSSQLQKQICRNKLKSKQKKKKKNQEVKYIWKKVLLKLYSWFWAYILQCGGDSVTIAANGPQSAAKLVDRQLMVSKFWGAK